MNQRAFLREMIRYMPSLLLPALTGFVSAPILTRLFLPSEYGDYALALGVSDFLFALTISGLAASPVRFLPAYKASSEEGSFSSSISISSGLVILVTTIPSVLVLFLLKQWITPFLQRLFLISIPIYILLSLFRLFMEIARAQERSSLYSSFELFYRYGSLGTGLLLAMAFGFGVDGLLWGEVLALGLSIPFLIRTTTREAPIRLKGFKSAAALEMWRYAWPLSLGNIAMWGLRLSDRYIIRLFRSPEEVGLYSVVYNISNKSIDLVVMLVLLTMGPLIMNTWEKLGPEATEKTLSMVTRVFVLVGLPSVAGLALLASPLVTLLTTPLYYQGSRIVGFVALSSFAWGLSRIASFGSLLMKDTARIGINQIVAAGITLGANFLLVPRYGFVAAGANSAVGFLILVVLQARSSQRFLRWRLPLGTARNSLVAVGAMGIFVYIFGLIQSRLEIPLVAFLAVAILGGIFVYFGSLLALGEARPEEMALLRQTWARLRNKLPPSNS